MKDMVEQVLMNQCIEWFWMLSIVHNKKKRAEGAIRHFGIGL